MAGKRPHVEDFPTPSSWRPVRQNDGRRLHRGVRPYLHVPRDAGGHVERNGVGSERIRAGVQWGWSGNGAAGCVDWSSCCVVNHPQFELDSSFWVSLETHGQKHDHHVASLKFVGVLHHDLAKSIARCVWRGGVFCHAHSFQDADSVAFPLRSCYLSSRRVGATWL